MNGVGRENGRTRNRNRSPICVGRRLVDRSVFSRRPEQNRLRIVELERMHRNQKETRCWLIAMNDDLENKIISTISFLNANIMNRNEEFETLLERYNHGKSLISTFHNRMKHGDRRYHVLENTYREAQRKHDWYSNSTSVNLRPEIERRKLHAKLFTIVCRLEINVADCYSEIRKIEALKEHLGTTKRSMLELFWNVYNRAPEYEKYRLQNLIMASQLDFLFTCDNYLGI